jgi:hypothetical protein
VEGYLVDWLLVSIVVLKKPWATDIPDLDWSVRAATSDAGSIRVEPNWVNDVFMVIETLDQWPLGYVPKLYSAIIRSRDNEPGVWRKLTGPNPIGMSRDREYEFAVVYLEDFQSFVIWAREQKSAIWREGYTLNWSWVALDHLWVTLYCVGPQPDCLIGWGRSDYLTVGRYRYVIDGSLVPNKAVRSQSGLEVPYH